MARQAIEIIRGQTFSYTGVLRDNTGERIDLTNLTLTWKAGDKDFRHTEFTLTEGNGITIIDATRGEWQVTIRNSDTKDQNFGFYRFQGFASDGAENNYLFTRGLLNIVRDIR